MQIIKGKELIKQMADMAKDYEFAWNNHIKIKNYCQLNIEYLSSCCDKKAIDFLFTN